ncbi:MAG TPA: TonB-dependent receptor, partial [Cyclobacteriaceae bacterium]|nr:TonB-dependent receptor [Cyclobacteriaceae bacterium]
MYRHLIVLFLAQITSVSFSLAQQRVTLSGYIKDAANGEELIGATVYLPAQAKGTVSNAYGFYSLTLTAGAYQVQVSYLGYKTQNINLVLTKNEALNIELAPESLRMQEVVIREEAPDANVVDLKMSRNQLDVQTIKKLPSLLGEADIIKTIQLLPGVISAAEGTSSFFVRGGGADQNLILIDEAPVYDPSHLFGLFSVFNTDVIKDAELYRGGIPAIYGGRLSSILDVRTKDGNNKQFSGTGGIGTLASRIMLEGPIQKDKSSYLLSARRSYADIFLKAAGETNLVYFYDVNAKVNWKPNNKNRFFVAAYLGRDDFSFDDLFGFDWGNATFTFRWNHLFNERLFSNTSVIASNFDYGLVLDDAIQGFKWTSNLQEFTLKEDFGYFLNPRNQLDFGYHVSYKRFSPGNIVPTAPGSIFTELSMQRQFALDQALYISNEQKLSDRLSLSYGLRLSIFQQIGEGDIYVYDDPQDNINIVRTDTLSFKSFENIKTFINPEPRFAMRYLLSPTSSVKASYNRMIQNTHLIASGTVPLPFNTWNPSGYYLEPQIADQIALGYFRNLKSNAFEVSAEVYYKYMQNITDFADNANIFFNEDLAVEYRQGESWSYGLELFAEKKSGDLQGFMSYTLSKTDRLVPGVNLDMIFPANYDRRHVFNLVASYDMNTRWTFGTNFTYSTGRPITVPAGQYEFGPYRPDYITERNGYRLPAFHRWDLSATFNPKKNENRRWQGAWIFSV